MAGRDTPGNGAGATSLAAMVAPELPAEIKASAFPWATSSAQSIMDESFFARQASAGRSCMPITVGACWMRRRQFGAHNGNAGNAKSMCWRTSSSTTISPDSGVNRNSKAGASSTEKGSRHRAQLIVNRACVVTQAQTNPS
jgi:hypothetical protein